MIVNKSGTLASVKRHDYLPFGEELFSGTGGRTTTQGYTGDSVRQHFTDYEADAETGLNFAEARYQSPAQGRFTSVDALGASATVLNPQSFNRYSYVNNNPTNLTDPSGMIPYNGADQSWGDVEGGFWGSYFDPNQSHFGGPGAIAEAEGRHDRWVDIDRAGGDYGDDDYPDTAGNVTASAEVNSPTGAPPNTETQVPCTINVNVSGATGQVLADAEDEITRILQSGGMPMKVVFHAPGNAQPGAFNLVIVPAFTGDAAAAIQRQARGVDPNSILGVTPTIGKSVDVNQTRISAVKSGAGRESSASLGTMIGRIAAHELIQHRLLGIPSEGTMKDVTSSRISSRELRAVFTTRFNLNPLTAAMLSNRCRP